MASRSRLVALVAALAAATTLGVFAASGLGEEAAEPAGRLDPARTEVQTGETERLRGAAASAARLGQAAKKAKKVDFKQLIAVDAFPVEPGEESVVALQCPSRHAVVTGGSLTQAAGLVTTNQSRANPTGGATAARTYYMAVVNLTEALGNAQTLEWTPTLVCAKNAKGD
jgi:hypothetical protein